MGVQTPAQAARGRDDGARSARDSHVGRGVVRCNRVRLIVALTAATAGMSLLARPASAVTDCQFTTSGSVMKLQADCTTDDTIFIPAGMALDGAHHTITDRWQRRSFKMRGW